MNRFRDRIDALEEAFGLKRYDTESPEVMQFQLERLKKMREDTYKIDKVERISAPPYYVFSFNRE